MSKRRTGSDAAGPLPPAAPATETAATARAEGRTAEYATSVPAAIQTERVRFFDRFRIARSRVMRSLLSG